MTKYGLFYQDMRHFFKNKNAHIMVNYSPPPIPQVKEKKKHYTNCGVKRANHESQYQDITGQPVNIILHAVDNNILHNLPII